MVERHAMFKHTGERPFPCSVCSVRFVSSSDLQRHFLKHTGEKPFPCTLCPARFRHSGSLKFHRAKKHALA
ncbi:UNVERIFIED_CONTAM: hypothetical protein GTU68_051274 [Idotea baltica]|nr:hypothetical protein [Idotea baltica]